MGPRCFLAIALLTAACSSDPTPDDTDGDDVGSSSDGAGTDGESSEGESSSGGGEEESTGAEPEPWPPACSESSPVVDPTCGVLQFVVAPSTCNALDTGEPDEARAGHTIDCAVDEDGWSISEVVLEWYRNGADFTLENAMLMRSDDLTCEGEPTAWLRVPGEENYPASWRLVWTSSWNDGELVFSCNRRENVDSVPPIPGEIRTECTDRIYPANYLNSECCLVSGTPATTSGLPTTPCEGGA